MSLYIVAIACVVVAVLPGCASVYTQTSGEPYGESITDCADSKTIPNVYSGTVFDLYCIPAENAGFFCLVDLPFSLVTDTVLLPYTGWKQYSRGSWYSQKECRRQLSHEDHATDAPGGSGTRSGDTP